MSFAVNGFAYFMTQYKNLPQKILNDIDASKLPPPPPPPPPRGLPDTTPEMRIENFRRLCNQNSMLQLLGNILDDYLSCFNSAKQYLEQYFEQPADSSLDAATADTIEAVLTKLILANKDKFLEDQERTVAASIEEARANLDISEFLQEVVKNLQYELHFASLLFPDKGVPEAERVLAEILRAQQANQNYFPLLHGLKAFEWMYVGRYIKTFESAFSTWFTVLLSQADLARDLPSGHTMLEVFAKPNQIAGAPKYLKVWDASVDESKAYTDQEWKAIVRAILSNADNTSNLKNEQRRTVDLLIQSVGPPTKILQDMLKAYALQTPDEVRTGADLYKVKAAEQCVSALTSESTGVLVENLGKINWTFVGGYYTKYFKQLRQLALEIKFVETNQHSLLQVLAQAHRDNAKYKEYFGYLHEFYPTQFLNDSMSHDEVIEAVDYLLYDQKAVVKNEQQRTILVMLESAVKPTDANVNDARTLLTSAVKDETFVAEKLYGEDEKFAKFEQVSFNIKPALTTKSFFEEVKKLADIEWCFAGKYVQKFMADINALS